MIKTSENWAIKEFGDIVSIKCSKFDPKSQNERRKCIELEHIEQQSGRIVGYTNTFESTSTKNVFSKGDVLFGKLRPYLRKFAQAPFDGVCSSEIWVFTPQKSIRNDFLYYLIQSDSFLDQANKSCGTKMPRADWKVVSKYNFLLPPLVEQQKIAEILSTVDKKIDLIDQKIAETEKLKTGLMQKLFSEGVGVQDENGNWQPHTEFKDSKLGKIPDSWNLGTVKDISPLQGGYAFKSKSATESGVRWLKIANVGKRRVTWDNDSYLPEKFIEEHSDFLLNEGDIVIALTRPVLSGELKVARLSSKDAPALLNQRVARINVNCSVADPGFVYYLFEDKRMANSISKVILGTDPPNISTKQIESFDIAIPPLEEQKSIRKVLSSVSSKIDLLVQQKAETQQLKKGLMQKLLTGEWRVPVEETEAA
ncbi:restriction endonuclease subunit S [Vibrio parahaemolyticus]|uniref:restriction endonuclease subunit S n=1 Tax=Vibrio parahaemolyticus TaxID=670 RepID=UPI00040E689A|nr:restriction endonuclease subunit S [Vibrio parahaemolyticus]